MNATNDTAPILTRNLLLLGEPYYKCSRLVRVVIFKWALPGFFYIFVFYIQKHKKCFLQNCWGMDSNMCPLVLEATALPSANCTTTTAQVCNCFKASFASNVLNSNSSPATVRRNCQGSLLKKYLHSSCCLLNPFSNWKGNLDDKGNLGDFELDSIRNEQFLPQNGAA